jgi:hypothetical protein
MNGYREDGMERMERRIERLEQDMSDIKSNVAVIKSDYVTRADLNASVNSLIKWIVGTAIALGAAGVTVITFVRNNASPPRAASQPQPIVIYTQPAPSPVPGSATRTP